jgi:hydrogenase assembly chaperone HypC/HupF
MCLGIPAQLVDGEGGHPDLAILVDGEGGHPDLAMADMGGVCRLINVGLLEEPPRSGDWVLVHMGFALSAMTPDEARDALAALGAENEAEREAAQREAAGGFR